MALLLTKMWHVDHRGRIVRYHAHPRTTGEPLQGFPELQDGQWAEQTARVQFEQNVSVLHAASIWTANPSFKGWLDRWHSGWLVRRMIRLSFALMVLSASAIAEEPRVVAYTIIDAAEIPASLTAEQGDPGRGRTLYHDKELTGCAGCHETPSAPRLTDVADRLSEGALRLWLVAPGLLVPGTEMPAYYALGQRDDPEDPRYGEPRLSAAEIEDLVAFLMTQRSPE